MALSSLRTRLLVSFAGIALLGVSAVTAAAVWQIRDRAQAQARADFTSQVKQVQRSLQLRRDAFAALSDLSYVLPVFRQVAAGGDDADFGLGSAQDDTVKRATLHQNLVDADWSWTQQAGSQAFVAVGDGQGRLLFTTADKTRFGDDLRGLGAVAAALSSDATATEANRGGAAMVVEGTDPAIVRSGLLSTQGWRGLLVVLVRATMLGGVPKALYLQGVRADDLLADVALSDAGAHISLVAPGGAMTGSVPAPLLERARSLVGDATAAVEIDGHTWLIGRQGLAGLGGTEASGQGVAQVVVARDLDTGLAILLQARNGLLLAGLLALLAAAIAALWQARRIAGPVQILEAATRKVAGGDLDVVIAPLGSDEIGRLGVAFSQMLEGLRDRRKLERTFKRYLAPEIVDYLLAHPEAQTPGGDRRALTVSFADLAGFTAFAESNPPERVVEILNACLGEMAESIVMAGGTVDKFMGDNCMGFYGAPLPRPDHAVRACKAALRQVRSLARLSLRGEWPSLNVRVGLNTGDMIVGTIGGAEAQDYTVVGDAVNLAARLEPANKVYGTHILCTQATVDAVQAVDPGAVVFREIDTVKVQGKKEPVTIFEVLGLRGENLAVPGPVLQRYAAGLAALRDGQFAAAKEHFEQALLLDPSDGPSQAMASRATGLLAEPPPHYDGTYAIVGK